MSEQLENIDYLKHSLDYMGEDELRKTLTYLIKVYVLDNNGRSGSSAVNSLPTDKNCSFFDLMSALKVEYTCEELSMFKLESGSVFFEMDNRRVEVAKNDSLLPQAASLVNSSMAVSESVPPAAMGEPQIEIPVPEARAPEENSPTRFKSLEF